MKSITIHNLDVETSEKIEKLASEKAWSLNKTIKALLRQALGIHETPEMNRGDFQEFIGVWNSSDAAEFDAKTEDLSKVDEVNW